MIIDSKFILEIINNEKDDQNLFSEQDILDFLTSQSETTEYTTFDTHELTKNLLYAFADLRLKMAEHMKLDNVLFLFGNGSSIYAGSQDTRKFKLEKYQSKYSDLSVIIDEVKKLKGIEEQLNALMTAYSYCCLMKDEPNKILVNELIGEIKSVLIDNYVNSIDYRKLSLHELFFLKLRSFGCLERTRIYTPNYDLAFEYSLDKLAIEYNDGFSGFINRIFDPRTLQDKGKTELVKIHGSINWTEEDGIIKEIQPKFKDGKIHIDDTLPVLIFPTYHKMYQTYGTPYSELMRHMLDEMRTGRNVIVVLGYKYGDDHINNILFKSLDNPNNIFYFFIYDEEENGNFIEQIKRLAVTMPNVNIFIGKILADFKAFVTYILPATPEKSDKEKVIELLQKVLVNDASS